MTDTKPEPTDAEKAVQAALDVRRDASKALYAVKKEREKAIDDATVTITAVYADRVAAANKDMSMASAALKAAENAAVTTHEWEGKRVVRDVRNTSHWGRTVSVDKDAVKGVVFTYRHGDDTGTLSRWRLPEPGQVMVRLTKKDGTPGKKIESFKEANPLEAWRLDTSAPA
jgi:hypothetical protein